MDAENRALCYFYKHPPPDSEVRPSSFEKIAHMVVKKDGERPSVGAVFLAVKEFRKARKVRGRRVGWRKTTKHDDKVIKATFHKLRPPGCGVDSEELHRALPLRIRSKVCPRTLRRRLAAMGYEPRAKVEKDDLGKPYREARLAFCSVHDKRKPQGWENHLQGCGDLCETRYYPRTLRARLRRYSAAWTYMTVGERKKPAFARPKKFFKRKELRGTQKCKVFGFTTSSGKQLAVAVPLPFTSTEFAVVVRRRLGPLLRAEFPQRRRCRILLDGEPLLHAPPAQAAFAQFGIEVLPNWPSYSPDLNPEENIWPWVLRQLRNRQHYTTSFAAFKAKVLSLVRAFPGKEKLIGSMAARLQQCKERQGAMTKF